ncbi:hypothetical protein BSR28_05990 [Boudabousia liubingyangii]|uniref:glycerophosphodiester phosphodiesterase family protein n=1 Tax=Boudabousia liubingyangii TaxID=1921764 RepID=UPI00093C5131|nr:glycerophosphodiester phosphodiesterase family protein [Boudabousia liubingyangii]OKL46968.1 hypothetical protein BSR28_05990 [Boudabousia liubingyangii]
MVQVNATRTADQFWAHRGIPSRFPENTLPSFQAAAEGGAKWIETDVDICHDGTLLICHDATLDRTTNASGPCADLRREDLSQVDAGAWFGPQFKNTPLPVLSEVVDLCLEHGLNLNLELKPTPNGAQAARHLVESAVKELTRFDDPNRVVISSFNPLLLATAQEVAPQFPRGALFEHLALELGWKTICEMVGATAIHPEAAHLTAELVAQFRNEGLEVRPWTVNGSAQANQLFNWGVTAIFTDRADWFIENL